ncbi:hypothetical protein EVAR_31930_1 [Eumeta japonica]|uniref:Uncharacterized protein n=1 Tax=Eumeta variegata TaxID=151549 RepID=A0A4C1WTI2_EUMVA|nr:hypothetical protein EVAR_31930_1 [Eumeta japonica]
MSRMKYKYCVIRKRSSKIIVLSGNFKGIRPVITRSKLEVFDADAGVARDNLQDERYQKSFKGKPDTILTRGEVTDVFRASKGQPVGGRRCRRTRRRPLQVPSPRCNSVEDHEVQTFP